MLDCINCTFLDAFPSPDDEQQLIDTREPMAMPKKTDPETDDNTALNTLKERDSLVMQLQQAKREIKMLRTERKLNRLEIERLKEERKRVQNTLEGKNAKNGDVLDSVFGW